MLRTARDQSSKEISTILKGTLSGVIVCVWLLLAAYAASLLVCRDDMCGPPNLIESLFPFIAENLFPYSVLVAPALSDPTITQQVGNERLGLLLGFIQWPLYGMLYGAAWRLRRRWWLVASILIAIFSVHFVVITAAKESVKEMYRNRVYDPG